MATKHPNDNIMKICLLGASFDTGNMGVSALAASTVQCIVKTFPDAEIVLLNYGESDGFFDLELAAGTVRLELVNISFSKRVWRFNHYLWQFFWAVLYRFLPWGALRDKIVKKSKYLQTIVESDVCLDISAGDSFSDIYGLYSFLYISSYKLLVLLLRNKLVLLPQTYGPFEKRIAKVVARYVLKRAVLTYSRDRAGVEYVRDLLNKRHVHEKVRFAPDVAFVLEALKPGQIDAGSLKKSRNEGSVVVGVNVSGLLLNGGHTRDNMFGLRTDYRGLVYSIVKLLLKDERSLVLLVPHVFHSPGDVDVESDSEACMQVYNALGQEFKGRLFLTQGQYNQSEIKHVIGMCDFFVGARMHSCIAAISQGIPTVGLAYSKKFKGVFEAAGVGDSVIDMRCSDRDEILAGVAGAYEDRKSTAERLRKNIPKVQEEVLQIFKSLA